MKVITLNVNGIRAAAKKGLFEWLAAEDADVVCLQEVRAGMDILKKPQFQPQGYYCFYEPAVRPGYSGVAVYSKKQPDKIVDKLGWDSADEEGRYLQLDFGDLSIVSIYLPSGSHSDERQQLKYVFMDNYMKILQQQIKNGRNYIICGDYNIVHKEIDIKNFKSNQKNSGCLPEERAWLDDVFNKVGFVDAFRVINKEPGQYTWWSNRGNARANNVGWRIDYQAVSPTLKSRIKSVAIYKEKWFSDHAPLIVNYSCRL